MGERYVSSKQELEVESGDEPGPGSNDGSRELREMAAAAGGRAAESTKQTARDAKLSAQKVIIDKMQQSVGAAESKTHHRESTNQTKKRSKLPILLLVLVALLACGAFVILNPAIASNLTDEDYISTSQLKKAIDVEGLSSVEFVYNGIAEKYKNGTDEVEYRVSYDSTVKADITMSDIEFEVDNTNKVIKITLPEINPSSVSVSTSDLYYMPERPQVEVEEILGVCEDDVKKEAEKSATFYSIAEENFKSVIEALTMPVVGSKGYTIEWSERQAV